MKKILYYSMILLGVSCTQLEDFTDPKDSVAPGPVTNVGVVNLNGGARITYTPPSDEDLMGVKVTYTLKEGDKLLEKYASSQNNAVELEGFGDTGERTVTLYAVDRSGNVSEGVNAIIKPDTPPILLMRESLEVNAALGGIAITWNNEFQKDMSVALYVEDPVSKQMLWRDTYFSNRQDGSVAFRGFDVKEYKYKVEISDRWGNYAEPLETSIVPLKEEKIIGRVSDYADGFIWKLFDTDVDENGKACEHWRARGDIYNYGTSTITVRKFEFVHKNTAPSDNGTTGYWHPGGDGAKQDWYVPEAPSISIPYPMYFTIDMGRLAKYSRMNFMARLRSPNFSAVIPVDFEIWATNNPKYVSQVEEGDRYKNLEYWTSWEIKDSNDKVILQGKDTWKSDGWTKIATCNYTLANGGNQWYDNIPLTEEEVAQYRSKGYEYEFEDNVNAYRYLRFVINKTNRETEKYINVSAMFFWGAYAN